MDGLAAEFMTVTDAPLEKAQQYLQLSDGNLEAALQLYFDAGGVDMGATMPEENPTSSTAQDQAGRSRPNNSEVVTIESDDEDAMEVDETGSGQRSRTAGASHNGPASQGTFVPAAEDDEAMARRLQEELFAGGDMAGGEDGEGVRAPISRTTETLVGPGADWRSDPDEMRAAIAEQMMARQQAHPSGGRPGIFNQRAAPNVWDSNGEDLESHRRNLAEATGGASEQSSKSSMLAELFRPPFDIMTSMPWDEARDLGKADLKWLLVNIQDPSIFDCQVFNRDIWRDQDIKETVRENFIFMQYNKNDPGAERYINYYFHARENQDAYPHVAIVDPRTGEQVKVWSGPPVPKALEFLGQLHEFLDRYSLDVTARNPVAKRKPKRKAEADVSRMTEEQMLEMALQNSLAATEPGLNPPEEDPDALTKSNGDISGKGKAKADAIYVDDDEEPAPNGKADASPFSQISSNAPHTEPPPDSATTTRIQVRHPAGRVIRRFALADPVRRIYEWLKAEPLEGKEGVEFELISMGKNLMESIDLSIEEAGLRNGTVMIEFVEG